VQQRLAQLREVQAQPVHRRRDEQVEVLGEEEARQRGDDVRQHQDRYEGKQNQAEHLAGNERAQLLHRTQRLQDLVEDAEHTRPEQSADQCQDDELAAAAPGAFFAQPLQGGPPLGL